jgi:hypothetical protein
VVGRYPRHLTQLNDAIFEANTLEGRLEAEAKAADALYAFANSLTPESPVFEDLDLELELREAAVAGLSPHTDQRPLPGDFLRLACLQESLRDVEAACSPQQPHFEAIRAQQRAIHAHMSELLGDDDSLDTTLWQLQNRKQRNVKLAQVFRQLSPDLQQSLHEMLASKVLSQDQLRELFKTLLQLPEHLRCTVW